MQNSMNNADQLRLFFSMFTVQLPMLLVCLAATVIVLVRWKQGAQGSVWALIGFAAAAILCVLIPAVQAIVQSWCCKAAT